MTDSLGREPEIMIMTPEERAEQRRIRAEVQAERDAEALAHAKAHPLTEKEKEAAIRLNDWLNKGNRS
jgi:hypothetical protein